MLRMNDFTFPGAENFFARYLAEVFANAETISVERKKIWDSVPFSPNRLQPDNSSTIRSSFFGTLTVLFWLLSELCYNRVTVKEVVFDVSPLFCTTKRGA